MNQPALYLWSNKSFLDTTNDMTLFAMAESKEDAIQVILIQVRNETYKNILEKILRGSEPQIYLSPNGFIWAVKCEIGL